MTGMSSLIGCAKLIRSYCSTVVVSMLERLLSDSGFESVEQRTVAPPLRLPSAADAIAMMQDAFGAYRAVVSDCSEAVRSAAWAEVTEALKSFETPTEFEGPTELLIAAGVKPS